LVKYSKRTSRLRITVDGEGLASHAGLVLLVQLADRIGLTDGLSRAMEGVRIRRPKHDPGVVFRDLSISLANGGDCMSDIAVLQGQEELFGQVASIPTVWRAVNAVSKEELTKIRTARAQSRAHLWANGGAPEGDLTLDFDGTLVDSHSEKERAAGTYKHGFGFYPLVCYLDETGEPLAGILRPGSSGSETASDHIKLLHQALAQIPEGVRGNRRLLARSDSGGATHQFAQALRKEDIRFTLGYKMWPMVRDAIEAVPEVSWQECLTQDGGEDWDAHVCELSGLDLSEWPTGTRAICRREHRHPGAQVQFPNMKDYRFLVFITDQDEEDIRLLELEYRRRAHVEDGIRCAKNLGLRNFPSWSFASNQVWLELLMMSQCLLIWFQQNCLTEQARWWEPKRVRSRLLHVSGRVAHSGRQITLRLPRNWPWAELLAHAATRVRLMPAPP
jgi:hypothetical protein